MILWKARAQDAYGALMAICVFMETGKEWNDRGMLYGMGFQVVELGWWYMLATEKASA
jgi:hypothetical protein